MEEFSKILDTDKLLQKAKPMTLEASVDECAAIAKRLGLQSLDAMEAILTVTPPTAIQKRTRLGLLKGNHIPRRGGKASRCINPKRFCSGVLATSRAMQRSTAKHHSAVTGRC